MSLVKSDSHSTGAISPEVFARQEGSVHCGNCIFHDGDLKSVSVCAVSVLTILFKKLLLLLQLYQCEMLNDWNGPLNCIWQCDGIFP